MGSRRRTGQSLPSRPTSVSGVLQNVQIVEKILFERHLAPIPANRVDADRHGAGPARRCFGTGSGLGHRRLGDRRHGRPAARRDGRSHQPGADRRVPHRLHGRPGKLQRHQPRARKLLRQLHAAGLLDDHPGRRRADGGLHGQYRRRNGCGRDRRNDHGHRGEPPGRRTEHHGPAVADDRAARVPADRVEGRGVVAHRARPRGDRHRRCRRDVGSLPGQRPERRAVLPRQERLRDAVRRDGHRRSERGVDHLHGEHGVLVGNRPRAGQGVVLRKRAAAMPRARRRW